MATIARWNGHKFEISPSVIRGFTDLQLKGSSETTEKTSGGEKYVAWKNTQPAELSLTAHFNAYFGCDVRKEAVAFVTEARQGKSDYFYAYQNNQYSKLISIKMMLTGATVSKVVIAPTGQWVSADVALTMKACKVSDSSSSSTSTGSYGGSGYTKTSVKSAPTTTTTTTPTPESARARGIAYSATIRDDTPRRQQRQVNQANRTIARIKKAATAATAAKKANPAKKSTGVAGGLQARAARV